MARGTSAVFQQITAPIDLHRTVGKADRNVDIPFPPSPGNHLHGAQTGLGIGFLECDRFRLRPGFSAQDEHAVTQIGGSFSLSFLSRPAPNRRPSLSSLAMYSLCGRRSSSRDGALTGGGSTSVMKQR